MDHANTDACETGGRDRAVVWLIVALAALPFLAKATVLAAGVTGYGFQSLYKLFQLAVPCGWRAVRGGKRGIEVLWPTEQSLPSVRTWMLAVLTALVLSGMAILAAVFMLPRIGLEPDRVRAGMDARFPISAIGAVLVVLFLSSVNAALEELHFRAWLDRELAARWGSAAGLIISAGAFGGMHVLIFLGMPDMPLVANFLVALSLAVAGATWSCLMRLPGGIHAAWLSHGLTDLILLGWGLHWLGYI